MHVHTFTFITLLTSASTIAIPAPTPTATSSPDKRTTAFLRDHLHKRQTLPDILSLASAADIPLPTDPAALLALYPLATELVQFLPTAPVLSVLETAVPSGFLSQVVHDPSYASELEAAFATGGGPGWFSSLPTDVRSYLHTYQVAPLVSEVGGVESAVASGATLTGSLPHSIIGGGETTGSVRFGPLISTATGASASGSGATGVMPTTATTGQTAGSSGSVLSGTNMPTSAAASGSSSAAQTPSGTTSGAAPSSTSPSTAGASHETGIVAAGAMAAAGVLGLVAML